MEEENKSKHRIHGIWAMLLIRHQYKTSYVLLVHSPPTGEKYTYYLCNENAFYRSLDGLWSTQKPLGDSLGII